MQEPFLCSSVLLTVLLGYSMVSLTDVSAATPVLGSDGLRDVFPTFQITERTKICSLHFKPTDFRKSLTGRRYLMDDAVPSILTWSTASPKCFEKFGKVLKKNCSNFNNIVVKNV